VFSKQGQGKNKQMFVVNRFNDFHQTRDYATKRDVIVTDTTRILFR